MANLFFMVALFLGTQAQGQPIKFNSKLPAEIPETARHRDECFLPGEREEWLKRMPRVTVSGCRNPILLPPKELNLNAPYLLGTSIYECRRLRRYIYNVESLSLALREFINLANQTSPTVSTGGNATCLANTLYTWAKNDGLGKINLKSSSSSVPQALASRAWYMGGFASVYAKLPSIKTAALRMGKDDEIQAWFKKRGNAIVADVRSPDATKDGRHLRNISFWKGYSLIALSSATGNAVFAKESRRIFDLAIGQISHAGNADEKGYLPMELDRENKAHHYHLFALKPILGMLGMSKALNCTFAGTHSDELKIAFLIRKIAEGNKKPKIFKNKTGFTQDATPAVEGNFDLLGGDQQAEDILRNVDGYLKLKGMKLNLATKPVSDNYLGGNVANFPSPGALEKVSQSSKEFRQFCSGR